MEHFTVKHWDQLVFGDIYFYCPGRTLCISSQAGCALQCTFCATGAQGFDQNLDSSEIIGQLWLANFMKGNNQPITNVVFG